jgi:hypothetical protein
MAQYKTHFTFRRIGSATNLGLDVCKHPNDGLCHRLKKTALSDLINIELVREYAKAHGITVSKADIDRQWQVIFARNFGGNPKVVQSYTKRYGITVAGLKTSVRDDLLQQRVMYQVTKNMPLYAPATLLSRILVGTVKGLHAVQKDLRSGVPFLVEAHHLNTDKKSLCHAQGCGLTGYLPNALLPQQQQVAATATPGTLLPPFASQGGFTLIAVSGHRSHYHLTVGQQATMRELLFARWLTQQQQHASIKRYVAT